MTTENPSPAPAHRFRKRPVVISAIQWDGTESGIQRIKALFPDLDTCSKSGYLKRDEVTEWRIRTLEGAMRVNRGDWVLRGVKGELYACKHEIFAETYEAADTPAPAPAVAGGPDWLLSGDVATRIGNEHRVSGHVVQAVAKAVHALRSSVAAQPVRGMLEAAAQWIERAPHGDNCFVSDHYPGDPGDRCNCGKDGLLSAIEQALDAAPQAPQPVDQSEDALGLVPAEPVGDLDPNEDNPYLLWAEIARLRAAVAGPDGYASWQDAATAERVRRVRAEAELAKLRSPGMGESKPDQKLDGDLVRYMAEKIKAEAEAERARKAALMADGTCPECEGTGEQGGQFCGGYWKCEACGGTGNFDTQVTGAGS